MLIEYRNGKRQELKDARAKYLIKIKRATQVNDVYQTRDMADQPKVIKAPEVPVSDGLDAMDKAQLHALAKERGLQLHHMLGADKVRAALRGESQE
jgi:hypothetical protein